MPDASDPIVQPITKRPRDQTGGPAESSPSATQPPQNVEDGGRADQERAFSTLQNHTVRQPGPSAFSYPCLKRFSIERGKPEQPPVRIHRHNEAHQPVAQAAVAVIIDDFRCLRFSRHIM